MRVLRKISFCMTARETALSALFPERRYLLSGWGGYQAVSCHCLDLAGFVHCGT